MPQRKGLNLTPADDGAEACSALGTELCLLGAFTRLPPTQLRRVGVLPLYTCGRSGMVVGVGCGSKEAPGRQTGVGRVTPPTLWPVWASSVPAHDAQGNAQDQTQLDTPGQKPHAYQWWLVVNSEFNLVCSATSHFRICFSIGTGTLVASHSFCHRPKVGPSLLLLHIF